MMDNPVGQMIAVANKNTNDPSVPDPYVIAEMYWRPIIIVLGIIAAAIIIILMMLVFAWLKARSRTKERLDRRNSLRASIRSSKASVLANSRANLTTPTPLGEISIQWHIGDHQVSIQQLKIVSGKVYFC